MPRRDMRKVEGPRVRELHVVPTLQSEVVYH